MEIDAFIGNAWRDHATDAEGVFARLSEGIPLATEGKHLAALAALIVHVAGEHLGRWGEGIELLRALEELPCFESGSPEAKSVLRSEAILHRCAGDQAAEERCLHAGLSGGDIPEASDRIRVLAVAASAMAGQKRIDRAARDFAMALDLAASYAMGPGDPAARALAVTGNNLACEMETRDAPSAAERDLMLRAAFAGRDYWRIAGGWMEEERAEYRLAMSHVKAGDPATALAHARRCMEIVEANGADPFERFFAHEAIARSRLAAGDPAAARADRNGMDRALGSIADPSLRAYCAGELEKLDKDLSQS